MLNCRSCRIERHPQVGRRKGSALGAQPRESQQVGDQPLHASGALGGAGNVLPRLGIYLLREAMFQQPDVTRHRPQRFLQVVRRHIAKLLQVQVRALQVFRHADQRRLGDLAAGDFLAQLVVGALQLAGALFDLLFEVLAMFG
jgi:hypothetical protein